MMNNTTGTKVMLWSTVGSELTGVMYDLRYMVICSLVLIVVDFWWGYSESQMRKEDAKRKGNATLQAKYEWHKSRALRRSANKTIDYLTYIIAGVVIGLGITEPMEMCSHIWTAAFGLGIGCTCEITSIIGHIIYVKMGVEVSAKDVWKALMRFLGRLIKVKSQDIGDAVEDLGRNEHRHRHTEDCED